MRFFDRVREYWEKNGKKEQKDYEKALQHNASQNFSLFYAPPGHPASKYNSGGFIPPITSPGKHNQAQLRVDEILSFFPDKAREVNIAETGNQIRKHLETQCGIRDVKVPDELLIRSFNFAAPTPNLGFTSEYELWGAVALAWAQIEQRSVNGNTTSGMSGFQERDEADMADFAVGTVTGYRRMNVVPDVNPNECDLEGAMGNGFFRGHEAAADRYRIAECKHTGLYHTRHTLKEIPASGCGCGWWAYWDLEDAISHYGGNTGYEVIVAVEAAGNVVLGEKGFRSTLMRANGLFFTWPGKIKPGVIPALEKLGITVLPSRYTMGKVFPADPNYSGMEFRQPGLWAHSLEDLYSYGGLLLKYDEVERLFNPTAIRLNNRQRELNLVMRTLEEKKRKEGS
jgi:hypothetical protein